jgi:hypothetical protein
MSMRPCDLCHGSGTIEDDCGASGCIRGYITVCDCDEGEETVAIDGRRVTRTCTNCSGNPRTKCTQCSDNGQITRPCPRSDCTNGMVYEP